MNQLQDEIESYIKLYTLLYADDTVILAENETELQKALDALEEYCNIWQLQVNLNKTKIIIFSRGKVKKHRDFMYKGNIIEVVSEYIYLGVTMQYNNKFSKAIQKQILLARKALFALNSKIMEHNLPIDIQLNLFDKLIVPILTYGCEIWGFTDFNSIEIFQRRFIRNCLNINKFTAKSIVYGESGVEKIENKIYGRMISFWNKLKQNQSNKISYKMFQFVKQLHDNDIVKSKWCCKLNDILNKIGKSYLWNAVGVGNHRIKTLVKQTLKDSFIQNWSSDISNNTLCLNYRIFKRKFCLPHYLTTLDKDLRIPLARYRCGSHHLPVSKERYNGVNDTHLCPLCTNDTGDEYHYILVCPAFDSYRRKYLDLNQYDRPNIHKLYQIFNDTNKIRTEKLSKFIKVILFTFRP